MVCIWSLWVVFLFKQNTASGMLISDWSSDVCSSDLTYYARSIARTSGAHVIGSHAETLAAVPLIAPMEIPDPAATEALQAAARRQTSDIETIFKDRTARGRSAEWRGFVSSAGYATASVMEIIRAGDLVVASQGDPANERRPEIENML